MVITLYSGPEWAPGADQGDHIEFSNAVAAAYDSLPDPPRWLFENGPQATHGEVGRRLHRRRRRVAGRPRRVFFRASSRHAGRRNRLAEQVDMTTQPPLPGLEGSRSVEFIMRRSGGQ